MDYEVSIKNGDLLVYCPEKLEEFSKEFINHYNENIEQIKKELDVNKKTKFIVALTDDEKQIDFPYGKSSISGFFTDTGAYAYIDLNGNRTKDYMIKCLMHELIHHLYKYYVYGEDKERITWVDEGLAQLLSGQKEELKDEAKYNSFIKENLSNTDDININELNHRDRSFGNNNGYNLSYIAVRYLYENNSHEEFINIIKDHDRLIEYGNSILKDIKKNHSQCKNK